MKALSFAIQICAMQSRAVGDQRKLESDWTLTFDPRSNLTLQIHRPYMSSYYCITHFIRISLLVKELQATEAPIGTTLHI